MKARGNGNAARWARMRGDLPLAKALLRDTEIGIPAWDLDRWKKIARQTDNGKADLLATQLEWWQSSIGAICIMIDNCRKALEHTADRLEGLEPNAVEMGGKNVRAGAWQYLGTQKQYLTIGQTVTSYGKAIIDKVFQIPMMVCGERTMPQILDLRRFSDNALPIKRAVPIPAGGNLSAGVIRNSVIGNAVAAFVRLLEVCKRTHPKCAAGVEELEIDIEEFNAELFNGYSQALLDIRKRLLADFRRGRVALADFPTDRTGADAGAQADGGTAGALPVVVRFDEAGKSAIAQAVADGTEWQYRGLRDDIHKAREVAEANGEKLDGMANELAAWRLFVTMVLAGKIPDPETRSLSANVRRKVCETWDEYTRGEADIAETKANDRTRKRSFKECLEVWGERPIYKGQTLKQLVGDSATFRKIVHNRDEQTRQKKAK